MENVNVADVSPSGVGRKMLPVVAAVPEITLVSYCRNTIVARGQLEGQYKRRILSL